MENVKFLLSVPGYELRGIIGQGGMSTVYEAVREGQTYAIKVFKYSLRDSPSRSPIESLRHFRREGAALARINHQGIVRVFEVGETGGQPYLVMEKIEGESLAKVLEQGPMSSSRVVQMAKILADTVGAVHRCGLVHRDLKPGNILLDSLGTPKIIDFGLAVRHEEPEWENLSGQTRASGSSNEEIAGTFLYSSPEQIGLIRQYVDGKSDLYSLGCVLFECATGQIPYASRNLNELLRMLSSQPIPNPKTLNPGMSPVLALIIQKLLARDPADRYASAAHLLEDLERMDQLDATLARTGKVQLGVDSPFGTSGPEIPFTGRQDELKELMSTWTRALESKGQVVIIEGQSGSGKSRLVSHLMRTSSKQDATILTGKCVMGSPVPLGVLREAVDQFLVREAELAPDPVAFSEKVRLCVGDVSPLLKNFSQELSKVLPQDASTFEVPSEDIYFGSIAKFLKRLSEQFSPMILFCDDIQWADAATKRVLGYLGEQMKSSRFLIVLSLRSEPEYAGCISELSNELKAAHLSTIQLKPFSIAAMKELMTVILGGRPLPQGVFFERTVNLSQGSPLALGEYLKVMLESGCLYPSGGNWVADLEEIDKLKLSADVMDIIIKRIASLEDSTQNVLRAASVLGSHFSKTVLQKVLSQEVDSDLYQANQANLIEKEDQNQYRFVHDRVQEALIGSIDKEVLKKIHERIAQIMGEEFASRKDDQDFIYSLAKHSYGGERDSNPERAYDMNLLAGKIALKKYSSREAFEFLSRAAEIKESSRIERPGGDLLSLQAEASVKSNRFNEAMEYLQKALLQTTLPFERAEIYSRMIQAQQGMSGMGGVASHILNGLKELGIRYQKKGMRLLGSVLWHGIVGLILHKTGWRFGTASEKTANQYRLECKLYAGLVLSAIAENKILLVLDLTLRQIYKAHFIGPSPELTNAFSSYAMLSAGFKLRGAAEKYSKLALDSAEQFGNPMLLLKVKGDLAVVQFLAGNCRKSELLARDAYSKLKQWVTRDVQLIVLGTLSEQAGCRGHSADAIFCYNEILKGMEKLSPHEVPMMAVGRLAQNAMLGNVRECVEDLKFIEATKVIERMRSDYTAYCASIGYFLAYYYEAGGHPEELQRWRNEFLSLKVSPLTGGPLSWIYYIYETLGRLRACLEEKYETGKVDPVSFAAFKKALSDLSRCGHPMPGEIYAVGAGAAEWLEGKRRRAIKLLDLAETQARESVNPLARYEALQVRAGVFRDLGLTEVALEDARTAIEVAEKQGWTPRVQRVRSWFHLTPESEYSSTSTGSHHHSHGHSSRSLHSDSTRGNTIQNQRFRRQLEALVQLNRASARQGSIEEQTEVALDEVVRILNAERAFLILGKSSSEAKTFIARDAHQQAVPADRPYTQSVVDQVYRSKQPYILAAEQDTATAIRSAMAAPLMKDEALIGILLVDSTIARGIFQEEDLEILGAICGHLAVNLEAARARQLAVDKSLLEKEQELTEIRVRSAHAAGMAEIATGSIHNIGNTLTSVVATFDLLKDSFTNSKVSMFVEGSKFLKEGKEDYVEFIKTREKAVPLLNLFVKLGDVVTAERAETLRRLEAIESGIANVKEVILRQQEYAQSGLHVQNLDPKVLMNEVLEFEKASLMNHSIHVVKEFSATPKVAVQKNKLLNVILNLLKNAKEAMLELPEDQRIVTLRVFREDASVVIQVSDRGYGIPRENLNRIFSHSFTTKKGGHGFGLHMSANAMTEMGGKLVAESEGLGKGATFKIVIPLAEQSIAKAA